MYCSSSQLKKWTFRNEEELAEFRRNQRKRKTRQATPDELTEEEEATILRQYSLQLREFCRRFQPPMPRRVAATAFHYLNRFYLRNSPQLFHPKEILATCAYLACKVDEFNVSIDKFVSNIKGDREKAADIILSKELLLMRELDYQLTVHTPHRAVEGFLIDLKTRTDLPDPDRLRRGIDDFLDRSLLSDAGLLYSPAQLALAAVLHAASKQQENLDSYVTETLLAGAPPATLHQLIEAVRNIRSMVKNIEYPAKDRIKQLEKKLERCRQPQPQSHPSSQSFPPSQQPMTTSSSSQGFQSQSLL